MKRFALSWLLAGVMALVGTFAAQAANTFSAAPAYYSANSATASTTATANQMGLNGVSVLDLTGTIGGAANLTTPTAATILANNPNVPDQGSYLLRIISETAANTWTVVGGTGVTVTGTATVTAGAYTDFVVTFNRTAGTVTLQRAGSGSK